ncbi:protein-L-isoaspartate(D-aspartate) O-methyltransferase [Crocinitomix catalasitica]|nr:protein-L-isoaspartate(D-aspartate) O-methyltransferase [Crocinitomix catalasitica]
MIDSYKHKGLRKRLVAEIKKNGIRDKAVLKALDKIPRHFFLDGAFIKQAYSNKAFRIGAGQTISQPYTVAFQTELLQLKNGEKVLEIGTGSGFQTCILCELGAKVFSIERQKELHLKAAQIIRNFGYSPKLKYGDGYAGWPSFHPFDKILVTCGAPGVPDDLLNQLAPNGRMVIPVGEGEVQEMLLITKSVSGEVTTQKRGVFSFVPMLKEKEK